MKVIVNPHDIKIIKEEAINEKEVNVSKCYFEFSEEYTEEFVKKALFTKNNKTYEQLINNNECDYPPETIENEGLCLLGVYAYKIENDEIIKRYTPSPKNFAVEEGSIKSTENSKPITPSEMEQYEQALNDGLNDVRKELKIVQQIGQDIEKKGSETEKQGNYAKEQGTRAENIVNTVQEKLDNGEFIGPEGKQGIQGEKGDCNFATFDVVNGKLIMRKTEDMLLKFKLDGNKLKVVI